MKTVSSKRAKALQIPTSVKRAVYARDQGLCVCCGRPGLPEAHYIPRSKGGLGIEQNIVTLCRECHDTYDRGYKHQRAQMRRCIAEYLCARYDNWDEEDLVYRKE